LHARQFVALRKLGHDIKDARRRRRIPMAIAAERASISKPTFIRVERGDPSVSIGSYATVLYVLGMADRLGDLAAPKNDPVGLQLEEENLPQRAFAGRANRNARKTSDGQRNPCVRGPRRRPAPDGAAVGRVRKNKESATFEYDEGWLQNPARFSLEPALQLGPGPFHTPADTPMFGAIGDSAPDRWGRALMRRMERSRAEREGTAPRTLQEIDFLLLVDDEARQGALRFAEREGGPFLREEGVKRIPPLVELPKLLSAAEHVMEERTPRRICACCSRRDRRSAARVRRHPSLKRTAISRLRSFRARTMKSTRWCGKRSLLHWHRKPASPCPKAASRPFPGKPVLLLRRFDRDGKRRIPFLSAMSMLGSKDNEGEAIWKSSTRCASTGPRRKPTWRRCGGGWCSIS
jgi:serine/threonine-protein kinase HipA